MQGFPPNNSASASGSGPVLTVASVTRGQMQKHESKALEYYNQNSWQEALNESKKALDFFTNLEKPTDTDRRTQASCLNTQVSCLNKLGSSLYNSGSQVEAVKVFEQAMGALAQVQQPADDDKRKIAVSFSRVAYGYYQKNSYEEAAKIFSQVVALFNRFQKLTEYDTPNKEECLKAYNACKAYKNANAQAVSGSASSASVSASASIGLDKAEKRFRDELETLEKIPVEQQDAQYKVCMNNVLRNIAGCQNERGIEFLKRNKNCQDAVERFENLDEAEEHFKAALETLEKIPVAQRDVQYKAFMSKALRNIASCQHWRGHEFFERNKNYQDAVERLENLDKAKKYFKAVLEALEKIPVEQRAAVDKAWMAKIQDKLDKCQKQKDAATAVSVERSRQPSASSLGVVVGGKRGREEDVSAAAVMPEGKPPAPKRLCNDSVAAAFSAASASASAALPKPYTDIEDLIKKIKNTNPSFKLEELNEEFELFYCEINKERCAMHDPVVLGNTGQTYHRSSIEQWLKNHDTDPNTNTRLTSQELTPNFIMRQMFCRALERFYRKINSEVSDQKSASGSADSTAGNIAAVGAATGSPLHRSAAVASATTSSAGVASASASASTAPSFQLN